MSRDGPTVLEHACVWAWLPPLRRQGLLNCLEEPPPGRGLSSRLSLTRPPFHPASPPSTNTLCSLAPQLPPPPEEGGQRTGRGWLLLLSGMKMCLPSKWQPKTEINIACKGEEHHFFFSGHKGDCVLFFAFLLFPGLFLEFGGGAFASPICLFIYFCLLPPLANLCPHNCGFLGRLLSNKRGFRQQRETPSQISVSK